VTQLRRRLAGARVLGDGLRSLADGVLGKFAGQQQTDGSLDLAARDRRSLVVVSETGRLGGDAFEDVVDERVHDAHRLARDTGVRVHLLENLVDVDSVALPPSSTVLLGTAAWRLRLGDGLLGALRCCFGRHIVVVVVRIRRTAGANKARRFYRAPSAEGRYGHVVVVGGRRRSVGARRSVRHAAVL